MLRLLCKHGLLIYKVRYSQSQTKILWRGSSANTATIRLEVPSISDYRIIGIRLHNADYPIVQCVVEPDAIFEGVAVRYDGNTFRFVTVKGRVEDDVLVLTEHQFDSYTVPALGATPVRNAGDWLNVVEVFGIS